MNLKQSLWVLFWLAALISILGYFVGWKYAEMIGLALLGTIVLAFIIGLIATFYVILGDE